MTRETWIVPCLATIERPRERSRAYPPREGALERLRKFRTQRLASYRSLVAAPAFVTI